jgi:hypothetical protein
MRSSHLAAQLSDLACLVVDVGVDRVPTDRLVDHDPRSGSRWVPVPMASRSLCDAAIPMQLAWTGARTHPRRSYTHKLWMRG